MARVRVKGHTVIRDIFGTSTVEIDVAEPETVAGLMNALLERYGDPLRSALYDPKTGELTPFPIRLNDELISSVLDRDRAVSSGDEIAIIFPVGGG